MFVWLLLITCPWIYFACYTAKTPTWYVLACLFIEFLSKTVQKWWFSIDSILLIFSVYRWKPTFWGWFRSITFHLTWFYTGTFRWSAGSLKWCWYFGLGWLFCYYYFIVFGNYCGFFEILRWFMAIFMTYYGLLVLSWFSLGGDNGR